MLWVSISEVLQTKLYITTMNKKLFSIVAAASMIASSAFARTDAWYVSAHGGADFGTKSKVKEGNFNGSEVKYKTGMSVGAAVGHSFDDFRFELELGYKNLKAKEMKVFSAAPARNVTSTNINGSVSIFSLMGNVYYDLPVMDQVDLYFGAGLGMANIRSDVKEKTGAVTKIDGNANVFAYQLMAGPAYKINDQWTVSLGYRFFGYTNPKLKIKGTKTKIRNNFVHSVELALRCSF